MSSVGRIGMGLGLPSPRGWKRAGGSPPVYTSPPEISLSYTSTPGQADLAIVTPGVWNDADTITNEWYLNGSPTGFSGDHTFTGLSIGDYLFLEETAENSFGTASADSNTVTVDPMILVPGSWWDNRSGDFQNASGMTAVDGEKIAKWVDRSGNGVDIIQTIDAQRPIFVVSGVNGSPSAQFSKAAMTSLTYAGSPAAGTSYTLVFVCINSYNTEGATITLGDSSSTGESLYSDINGLAAIHFPSGDMAVLGALPGVGSATVWVVRYSPSTIRFSSNGTQIFSGVLTAPAANSGPTMVGGDVNFGYYLDVPLGMGMVLGRDISDPEHDSLVVYLKNQFGIS